MSVTEAWRELGSVAARDLVEARLEAHWAVQTLSAVGSTHGQPASDDSHMSATLQPDQGALLGEPLANAPQRRVGLRLHDLVLFVLDPERTSAELRLPGHNLDDAFRFLERQLGGPRLSRPSYDLPAHPVRDGGIFTIADEAHAEELVRWYQNAHAVLSGVREREPRASALRVWPHQFDLAALIPLGGERSIGVGLSPGDASFAEPYFYVAPWPRPNPRDTLPALPAGGRWYDAGWFGAVLTGSALVAAPHQHAAADRFLDAAVDASRTLLA